MRLVEKVQGKVLDFNANFPHMYEHNMHAYRMMSYLWWFVHDSDTLTPVSGDIVADVAVVSQFSTDQMTTWNVGNWKKLFKIEYKDFYDERLFVMMYM